MFPRISIKHLVKFLPSILFPSNIRCDCGITFMIVVLWSEKSFRYPVRSRLKFRSVILIFNLASKELTLKNGNCGEKFKFYFKYVIAKLEIYGTRAVHKIPNLLKCFYDFAKYFVCLENLHEETFN